MSSVGRLGLSSTGRGEAQSSTAAASQASGAQAIGTPVSATHPSSLGSAVLRSSLLVQIAATMSRDTLFYTLATGAIFPIGLINAAILTRYLRTSQFGHLGLLYFASALMSVVLNLVALRGTERQVWGTGEEGVDVDQDELVEHSRRPRVLTAGVLVSFLVALLAIGAVIPLAPGISSALLGTPHLATAVVWAAISGAFGSVWRLSVNIPRFERRRTLFGAVWVLRPVLACAISWPVVALGGGVTGAMMATAIGTIASLMVCLVYSRSSFGFALDLGAAWRIIKSSAGFAAMVVGLYILHSGDVFFLSRFVDASQVGVYRLAGNLTVIISYGVSAFLLAWAPHEYSPLFRAAYDRHGKNETRMQFLTYTLMGGVLVVLLLSALATPLVGLFAVGYRKATSFVAITGAGFLAYGTFLVVARSSMVPRRYFWYGVAACLAASILGLTSFLLGRPLGGYGVAIGNITGAAAGAALFLGVAAGWGEVPPADVPRLLGILVIGGLCWFIGDPVAATAGAWTPAVKVASIALYPCLLIATRVIAPRQRRYLIAILRSSLHFRTPPEPLIARIGRLSSVERRVLVMIVRDWETPGRVSAVTGLPLAAVRRHLVAALRQLADGEPPSKQDGLIGEYLLIEGSITQRDGVARSLWELDVRPAELHQLEVTFNALRSAPAKAWATTVVDEGRELPPPPWPVDETALMIIEEAVRRNSPRDELARRLTVDRREVDRRVVGALRAIAGRRSSHQADSLIAAFLLDGTQAPPSRQLWAAGVDPLELHQLELTLIAIRSLPEDRWRRVAAQPQMAVG